jgi:hypothetical protein
MTYFDCIAVPKPGREEVVVIINEYEMYNFLTFLAFFRAIYTFTVK